MLALRSCGQIDRGISRRPHRTGWHGIRSIDIARAKRIQRELFSRRAVGVHQQRRHALIAQLVLETVDVIFGRKVYRRTAVIAKQIAHCVVVLAVRQPANQMRLVGRSRRFVEPLLLGREQLRSSARQILNPLEQDFFLPGAGFDAFAAGVLGFIGGLQREQ